MILLTFFIVLFVFCCASFGPPDVKDISPFFASMVIVAVVLEAFILSIIYLWKNVSL